MLQYDTEDQSRSKNVGQLPGVMLFIAGNYLSCELQKTPIYCRLTVFPDSGKSIGLTWLITLMGQNRPWVLGILVYGIKLERGENWFQPVLIILVHTIIYPSLAPFFICPSSIQ
jgi:hypothetical protein